MATPINNQSSSLSFQGKSPITTKSITKNVIKSVGVVVKTAIKVAALVIGLLIVSIALLPLLCIEAAVRLYMKCKACFIDDKDLKKPKLIIFAAAEDSLLGNPIIPCVGRHGKVFELFHGKNLVTSSGNYFLLQLRPTLYDIKDT